MNNKFLSLTLIALLSLALILPARAVSGPIHQLSEAPAAQESEPGIQIQPTSTLPALQTPSQEEIRAKWDQVTYATSLYATEPSVSAPYAIGQLSDNFLESGITYLNYVRFVAGLPEVTLDDTLTEDAQHGAVLLAAVDYMSHYPHQPSDMDDDFFSRGYGATTTSNISTCWGYEPLNCIQLSVRWCMDDSGDNNLSDMGHRRWLLNPTLGKVGFGYTQSDTGWSYIVTPVFDHSGAGCDYDFIGWPVAGNHPTNLFDTEVPWSLTLNPSIYQAPSLDTVKITITRESDGRQWHFDRTTGEPATNTEAYMTVNNGGYGIRNCIIFHPGSRNVDTYAGTFRVDVSGIFLIDGTETALSYDVNFFDVEAVCTEHNYEAVITEPTCEEGGYTTYTCTLCGNSYVGDHTDPVDHVYEDGHCKWCGKEEEEVEGLWGDVDGNGEINTSDARLVLQYYVGTVKADSLDMTVADVNGDGKVNTTDARLILQLYVGIIKEFPVEE